MTPVEELFSPQVENGQLRLFQVYAYPGSGSYGSSNFSGLRSFHMDSYSGCSSFSYLFSYLLTYLLLLIRIFPFLPMVDRLGGFVEHPGRPLIQAVTQLWS